MKTVDKNKQTEALNGILRKQNALVIRTDAEGIMLLDYGGKTYSASIFGIVSGDRVYVRNGEMQFATNDFDIGERLICAVSGKHLYAPTDDGAVKVSGKATDLSRDYALAAIAITAKTAVVVVADGSLSPRPEISFFSTDKPDLRFAMLSFLSFVKLQRPDHIEQIINVLQGEEADNG